MSIKQNFPTIDSTLNLDFANSRVVDSRIQFTRASAATVTDANGVLQTVRDNKPRIDFNPSTGECKGLLIEESRTNLMKCSDRISPGYTSTVHGFVAVTVIPFATTAPDGTLSATSLLETTATDKHCIQDGFTQGTAGYYTVSLYVKPNGRTKITLREEYSYGGDIDFDLSTQTASAGSGYWISSSGRIQSLTNGWYRISATINLSTANNYCVFDIIANSGSATSYAGDITKGFYVWGFQIEQGSFVTSYVSTTPGFTSRASSATYFDSTGVMRTAPTNSARYGYGYDTTTQKWVSQGLILEPAVTNLFLTSSLSIFNTGQNMDIVSTTIAALDGTTGSVYKLTPTNASTSQHSVYKNHTSSTPSTRCVSVYLKAAGYNYARIYCDGNTPTVGGIVYDLSTGTASVDSAYSGANRVAYGMENVGNGWYRCWVSGTSTGPDWYFHIDVSNTSAFTAFAGDGSSGVYAWGPQMEIGSVPTSYIPTFGATATRSADVAATATVTRAQDNAEMYNIDQSWFKNSEGSFYVEGYHSAANSSSLLAVVPGITNTWTAGMMQLSEFNAGATQGFRIFTSINGATASNQIDAGVTTLSTGVNHKFAGAWKSNDAASSVNTTAIATDNTVILPGNLSTLKIGSSYASSIKINGCIKKILYYPYRLSNTQLQALTV